MGWIGQIWWEGCAEVNGKATSLTSCCYSCSSSGLVQRQERTMEEAKLEDEETAYCFDWTNDVHRKCAHFKTPGGG